MPEQIIPIQGLHTVGLIEDSPAVSLPPNAFTDVLNVRFHNNAINKLPGDQLIADVSGQAAVGTLQYLTWWANPNIAPADGYYVLVSTIGGFDRVHVVQASNTSVVHTFAKTFTSGGDWQHTEFQGGYAIVLNNGLDRPAYILDATGNTAIGQLNIFDLPGWDSYHINETSIDDMYDVNIHVPEFDLGRRVDFTMEEVIVNLIAADGTRKATTTFVTDNPGTVADRGTIAVDTRTNTHTVSLNVSPNNTYLEDGDRVIVVIRSTDIVQVRAQVVRAWGDVLVAGGLTEIGDTTGDVLRNQTGVVRISDVAAPGSIPHNWNPYSVGVSTADEFTLATTGVIRELAELQGNLYVYTDNSIHTISRTGNDTIPYVTDVVTNSYGALSRDCVHEFNGAHIVVGSNDIYQFSGHPASIQSIATNRVQRSFYSRLTNPDNTFILLNRAENEIWFNYDTAQGSETLIWGYLSNTWSRRRISSFTYGVIAPMFTNNAVDPSRLRPTFIDANRIYGSDYATTFTDADNAVYESYFERVQAGLTPEFDVETLAAVAMWADGNATLRLRFRPTDHPGADPSEPLNVDSTNQAQNVNFVIGSDYKADVRLNGRFINFRITDAGTAMADAAAWNVSGMQLEVKKGGRR